MDLIPRIVQGLLALALDLSLAQQSGFLLTCILFYPVRTMATSAAALAR